MKVTRKNYEIYFLDYYEGNLSANQQAELFLFLEQHPDLKREFENFELISLPSTEEVLFPDKNSLKKEIISENNYQEFLIAKIEGDLTKEESHALNKFLFAHPEFKKEEKLFSYTKLIADEKIIFVEKLKLKQPLPIAERSKKTFYFSIAAAACILLMIGVYFIRQNNNEVMQANNQAKIEIVPAVTNLNKSGNENEKVKEKVNNNSTQTKTQLKEKVSGRNKPVFANNINSRKNKNHQKENEKIKNLPENKVNNTNEMIELMEQREIVIIEIPDVPQQIAFININLLKQQALESSPLALNKMIDQVSDPDAKNIADKTLPIFPQVSNPINTIEKKSVLDVLAWGFSKVSNEDVKLKKQYDNEGQLVAYQFESGKVRFGKSSAK